jgi:hypothetical protein
MGPGSATVRSAVAGLLAALAVAAPLPARGQAEPEALPAPEGEGDPPDRPRAADDAVSPESDPRSAPSDESAAAGPDPEPRDPDDLVAWPEGARPWAPPVGDPRAATEAPEQPPLEEGEERPVPDYDGREDRTTAGDVLIWVPRVVLSPLYFVSEFVVRRPLGWVATTAEKHKWPSIVANFLTFGPQEKMGIIPTGIIDFGLRPSVGLYYFWDDAGFEGNMVRVHVAYGGPRWYSARVTDRIEFGPEDDLSLRGEFVQRPDWPYHGTGPRAGGDPDEARFQQRTFQGMLAYRSLMPRSSRLDVRAGVRRAELDGSVGCCDEAPVDARVAEGRYDAPPGMNATYAIGYQELRFVLDSRPRRFPREAEPATDHVSPPGSGVRLAVRGRHAVGLTERRLAREPGRYHWVGYGATAGAYADVTGEQRVIGLTLTADFVDPVGGSPDIPIPEQVRLGGRNPMPGGLIGRLVDRSAATARFSYQWPVWVWIDGEAFYEVGNVFGERLEAFEWGLLRSSFGMGLRANNSRDHVFELLVAFLTDPIDAGHGFTDLRLMFGAANEF